eukprot:TRINITY_DN3729_c0_g1_i2.p1 TRINITY_DN3729_c0_g1~~TRINITY_DN3729_c0_g1_i2.p1  ORF type:complete len:278 (-),score=26.65 TRINITY_DN3729_c0_g1_i2:511-1344(-)
MGQLLSCCIDGTPASQRNAINKNKTQRIANWRATGVVGLRDAKLREFPPYLVDFPEEIKSIDATNNKIASLPDYLPLLTNLHRLILASNSLNEFVVQGGTLASLSGLKVLILDDNSIAELPDDIGTLVNLEKLSINGNSLTALNEAVGKLTKLQQISAHGNKLMSLPDSLGSCGNLEELDFSNNFLKAIPESLGRLSKLKKLKLDRNSIGQVPTQILVGCVSMHTLSLHYNPITMEVLKSTEGFDEFENRRKSKFDKIIGSGVLLGSGGVDQGIDAR